MSDFNKYARQADEYAKGVFSEYATIEAKYKAAEEKYKANHRPEYGAWLTDSATIAKYARIEADYQESKTEYEKLRREMRDYKIDGFKSIRQELEKAVSEAFAVNPEHLDSATVELLKSGIMKPEEYGRLMNKAMADNNPTMVRLIAKYASDRAEAEAKNDPDKARAFRVISHNGKNMNGNAYLQAFDSLTEVFGRCMKNTALISHWDSLTSEMVENF